MTAKKQATAPFDGHGARRHFDVGRRRIDGGRACRRHRFALAAAGDDRRGRACGGGAAGAGDVEAVAVDERLKLSRCAAPLDAKVERPIVRGDGTDRRELQRAHRVALVRARARPNDVTVLVLARNVQPGEVLTAEDVAVAQRSSASLPYDYLSEARKPSGLTMRRTQPAGAVITAGCARGTRRSCDAASS